MLMENKSNKSIILNGITFLSRKALCEYHSINYKTFRNLLGKGKTPQEIVNNPPKRVIHKIWTNEEVHLLKRYASSKTGEEIGIILDRSATSVLRKAKYENISMIKLGENHKGSKLSNLQTTMILVLSDAGYTPTEIHSAAFDHVTLSTINDIKFLRTHQG